MNCRNRGSITVEAAFILSIALLSIGQMILVCFSLHDKALSRSVLLETVEMSSHRGAEMAFDEQLLLNEKKLENVLCGTKPVMKVDPGEGGTVTGKDFRYEIRNRHIKPEKLMRMLTLQEILEPEEKNEENISH